MIYINLYNIVTEEEDKLIEELIMAWSEVSHHEISAGFS